jgi:LPXTG-motif cell wall-anchored protein
VHTSASMVNGSASLPFTGADVGELAAIGAGAIVIGGVLARRRRSAS